MCYCQVDKPAKNGKNNSKRDARNQNHRTKKWALRIALTTFLLSSTISLLSESLMRSVGTFFAVLTLLMIILLGILADLIGTAVTAADAAPFTAMAAKRVKGALQCVWLIKQAGKVSNILNDVVGDICAIVSGAAGAVIAFKMTTTLTNLNVLHASVLVSSVIAALMVGGKAYFKHYAIKNNRDIIYVVGVALYTFSKIKLKKIRSK